MKRITPAEQFVATMEATLKSIKDWQARLNTLSRVRKHIDTGYSAHATLTSRTTGETLLDEPSVMALFRIGLNVEVRAIESKIEGAVKQSTPTQSSEVRDGE